MKVSTYTLISHTLIFTIHTILILILIIILSFFPTDTFRANYGKWFGLGVEDYDKYKESLRRVVDEGEGVVLVMMDVGDVEEGCRLFLEREVDGWDDLVRFFFFVFFFVCLSLFIRLSFCRL